MTGVLIRSGHKQVVVITRWSYGWLPLYIFDVTIGNIVKHWPPAAAVFYLSAFSPVTELIVQFDRIKSNVRRQYIINLNNLQRVI